MLHLINSIWNTRNTRGAGDDRRLLRLLCFLCSCRFSPAYFVSDRRIAGCKTAGAALLPANGGVGKRKCGATVGGRSGPPSRRIDPPGLYEAIILGSASCFTTTPNHGSSISSDVSSPQTASLVGSGLLGLLAELS